MTNFKEKDLILPTLNILKLNKEGLFTSDLIVELRKTLKPSGDDLEILQNRKDDKFSQRVRNLISHKTLEKNSFAIVKEGKLFITQKGIASINGTNGNIPILNKNFDIGYFNLIKQEIEKIKETENFKYFSSAFYVYILNKLFSDSNFDPLENISDGNFCKESLMLDNGKIGGDDYGVDVFLIEEIPNKKINCKLFNFKSTENFETSKNKNFPGGELPKIHSFITRLKGNDNKLLTENITYNLKSLIEDIINYNNNGYIIDYEIIFVSNYYKGLSEKDLDITKNLFPSEKITEYTINDIIELLDNCNNINVKFRVSSDDFIELQNPIRSLIVKIDAVHLLRMVGEDKEFRLDSTAIEFDGIKSNNIDRFIFEENVRVHLNENKKNIINNSIKTTALENKENFFYFNNGITIVCKKYSCPESSQENKNSPKTDGPSDILLEKVQVVNGQQTIYSLFEAFNINNKDFSKIKVLCKIFEVEKKETREEIAEYTNSQNSVKKRDIRSIDDRQKLLQKTLEKDYKILYERKKNEFAFNNPNGLERVDGELVGQLIMSFYLEEPTKAKNKKSSIFENENYYSIFNEEHDSEKVYIVLQIYNYIVERRKKKVKELNKKFENEEIDNLSYEKDSYIRHCDLFVLFVIKNICYKNGIDIFEKNIEDIKKEYTNAIKIIEKMVNDEFFDENGNSKKFLLYGPFFKNKTSLDSFNKIFYTESK